MRARSKVAESVGVALDAREEWLAELKSAREDFDDILIAKPIHHVLIAKLLDAAPRSWRLVRKNSSSPDSSG